MNMNEKEGFSAGRDPQMNLVLVNGKETPWAEAYPRPEWEKPEHWASCREPSTEKEE